MQPNYPSIESGAYDPVGESVMCPECRSDMYLLATYDLPSASEFPAVEFDLWELIFWGWAVIVGNFIYGLITFGARKSELASLKRSVLLRYPHSLVCPRCLSVARRV